MAENVKLAAAPLTESSALRELCRKAIEEEGIDGFLAMLRLVCDFGARDALDERGKDRWRSRARFLAGVTAMSKRTEGR